MRTIIQLIVLSVILGCMLQAPSAFACKIMGQPSKKTATAGDVCRKECGFFGGWTGKAEDHLSDSAFPYVDCHCSNEPKEGLCQ